MKKKLSPRPLARQRLWREDDPHDSLEAASHTTHNRKVQFRPKDVIVLEFGGNENKGKLHCVGCISDFKRNAGHASPTPPSPAILPYPRYQRII